MRRIIQANKNALFSNIPMDICEDLALKAGDKLEFRLKGTEIIVKPVHQSAKINVQAAESSLRKEFSND